MRILIASDQWSPDVIGGSARVASDTARALARRGHTVTAIVPQHPSRAPRSIDEGVDVLRMLPRGRLPQTVTDPVATYRVARKLKIDLDVLVGHQATTAVGLGSGQPDVPLALVYHASLELESRFLETRVGRVDRVKLRALRSTYAALERKAEKRAAGVLVLSAFSGRLFCDQHPAARGTVHRVGGGVDASFLEPPLEAPEAVRARHGIPPDAVFLLTTRRLEPRMGLEELLGALAIADDPGMTLAITGDGGQRSALEALALSLGVQSRVRFLGRVGEAELHALYAAADLFVLPTVAYEGFGMSTVEALASGTPVLGTAVGATPEILGRIDDELIVPRADAGSLAEGIRRIVAKLTPELRARCAEHARAEYSWDTAIVRWEEALLAAIDGRHVLGNL